MTNPLIHNARAISMEGYHRSNKIAFLGHMPRLANLGSWLLQRSGIDDFHFHPKYEVYPAGGDKVALGFGGGIDSFCALHYALGNGLDVDLLHVNYGQPYFKQEAMVFVALEEAFAGRLTNHPFCELPETLEERYETGAVNFHTREDRIVPRDAEGLDWESYVIPARNLFLAAHLSEYARTIWIIANQRSDETVGTPDKTSRFYADASKAFSDYYNIKVRVSSPMLSVSKLAMVQNFLDHGGTVDQLRRTFSCYSPPDPDTIMHCGTCYACFKRFTLFQALNEEHEFAKHPKDGPNWLTFQNVEARKRG